MPPVSPTFEKLKHRLQALLQGATVFQATVYRSTTPKYATESDLVTGEGSKRNGGRWNPPGIAVIYASLTPETAMAETLAHHRYYGLPLEDAMPRTFAALAVNLQQVLDLRLGQYRQRLQVSHARIVNIDWRKEVREGREPLTQSLGRAAFELGLEGMIVPSAVDKSGDNLLVFPLNRQQGSEIRSLHPDRLRP
jgi:RES domain-containing protein